MNNYKITIIFLLLIIASCQIKDNHKFQQIVKEYYQTYQERNDFQKFLSYYDENMVLEDIMVGERIVGKEAFADFFDWENPNFAKTEALNLIISDQMIKGNQAVTQGYFTPFKWGTAEFPAMYFTTILTFNESGKIIKHVDWINYPTSLVDYNTRKNSNEWIQKSEE